MPTRAVSPRCTRRSRSRWRTLFQARAHATLAWAPGLLERADSLAVFVETLELIEGLRDVERLSGPRAPGARGVAGRGMTGLLHECQLSELRGAGGRRRRPLRAVRISSSTRREAPRRTLPRLPLSLLALGAVVVAAGAALALVLARDAPPEPLAPVTSRSVPRSASPSSSAGRVAPPRAGGLPGPIRLGAPTRCQFLYPDLDTQVMLVGLRRNGELTTEVPYPARREPR